MRHTKIAIIGVGSVGATIAYALMLRNTISELILVDINTKRCAGEVKDLSDVLGLSALVRLSQGSYEDAKKADIIIVAAGRPQKPGEARTELIDTNKQIFGTILNGLKGVNPAAVLIVVANPLDLLTHYAHKHFELPPSQVFGTGTFLDSQRLRHHISCAIGIAEESIDAFVLGEHGDSQLIAWSCASVGGIPLDRFGIDDSIKAKINQTVKNEAYEIIQAKGATYYGIATVVAALSEMIIFDTKQVVPVSWYHEEYQACFSLPVVLGERGVERVLPLYLNDQEKQLLATSAMTVRNNIPADF